MDASRIDPSFDSLSLERIASILGAFTVVSLSFIVGWVGGMDRSEGLDVLHDIHGNVSSVLLAGNNTEFMGDSYSHDISKLH